MLRSTEKKYGFSKKHRLTLKNDINLLFQKGKYASSGFLKCRFLRQKLGYTRVVISVSKRVGNSPYRNRLKRLIREALRTSGYLQSRSVDCAIYITKPLLDKPTLEIVKRYTSRLFSNLPDETQKNT